MHDVVFVLCRLCDGPKAVLLKINAEQPPRPTRLDSNLTSSLAGTEEMEKGGGNGQINCPFKFARHGKKDFEQIQYARTVADSRTNGGVVAASVLEIAGTFLISVRPPDQNVRHLQPSVKRSGTSLRGHAN
jgi:hypothetical protein